MKGRGRRDEENDWAKLEGWSLDDARWLELANVDPIRSLGLEDLATDEQETLVALASVALVNRLRSACVRVLSLESGPSMTQVSESPDLLCSVLRSEGVNTDAIMAEELRLFKRDFETWRIWTRKLKHAERTLGDAGGRRPWRSSSP